MRYEKVEKKRSEADKNAEYFERLCRIYYEAESFSEFRLKAALIGYCPKCNFLDRFWLYYQSKNDEHLFNAFTFGIPGSAAFLVSVCVFVMLFGTPPLTASLIGLMFAGFACAVTHLMTFESLSEIKLKLHKIDSELREKKNRKAYSNLSSALYNSSPNVQPTSLFSSNCQLSC